MARNISFSPRIQFHDTWTSTDYDRRGEIATCNRLTPSLAQAIKEELNSFKMVCIYFSRFTFGANPGAGDGGPRIVQSLHALLLKDGDHLVLPRLWWRHNEDTHDDHTL